MNTYQDLDLNFKQNNAYGSSIVLDEAAISQSIKNILLTRIGELPYNLNFGSNLHLLIFEKITQFTLVRLELEIQFALENWEPRIKINNINITNDDNKIFVTLSYNIITLNREVSQTINIGIR